VHVLDDVAFFGTGPGSGSAAMRRFSALPELRANPAGSVFLRAAIHPRAIEASLDAGNISRDNRRELVAIDLLRRRLRPLIHKIEAIELSARAYEAERRMAIDVAVRR